MNIIQAGFIIFYFLFFFKKRKLKPFSGVTKSIVGPSTVHPIKSSALKERPCLWGNALLPARGLPGLHPWPSGLQPTPERTPWMLPVLLGPRATWGPASFPCTIISIVKPRQTGLHRLHLCSVRCVDTWLGSGSPRVALWLLTGGRATCTCSLIVHWVQEAPLSAWCLGFSLPCRGLVCVSEWAWKEVNLFPGAAVTRTGSWEAGSHAYLEARSPESALLAVLPLGRSLCASAAPGAALLIFFALQPLVHLHSLQHSLSSVLLPSPLWLSLSRSPSQKFTCLWLHSWTIQENLLSWDPWLDATFRVPLCMKWKWESVSHPLGCAPRGGAFLACSGPGGARACQQSLACGYTTSILRLHVASSLSMCLCVPTVPFSWPSHPGLGLAQMTSIHVITPARIPILNKVTFTSTWLRGAPFCLDRGPARGAGNVLSSPWALTILLVNLSKRGALFPASEGRCTGDLLSRRWWVAELGPVLSQVGIFLERPMVLFSVSGNHGVGTMPK